MSEELLPSLSSMSQQKILSDEDFMNLWNKMSSFCRDREDCLHGNHPTLRELNFQTGVKAGQGVIATYLDMLNVATNYKLKLSDIQIGMLSQMIYEKFSYLKETEVALFFYDFFMHPDSEGFYGAIEMETLMAKFTEWVRIKRGKAILQHEGMLRRQKEEAQRPYLITFQEFCKRKGINPSETSYGQILLGVLGNKQPDTKESIAQSATDLIENKFGYDEQGMVNARRSFVCRYGYRPEDYLRKEGKYAKQ